MQDMIFNVATMSLTATSEKNIGACYATVVCYQHYFVCSTNSFSALAFDDYFRHNFNVTVPAGEMGAITTVVTQRNAKIEPEEYFKAIVRPLVKCDLDDEVHNTSITITDCTGKCL